MFENRGESGTDGAFPNTFCGMARLARIVAVSVAKTKNGGTGFFLLLRGILSRRRRRCGRARLRSHRIILLAESTLPESALSESTLCWSGTLGILTRRVDLLVQGIGQLFRGVPNKFEEAVISGLVVDDDGSFVDLAAHSDNVSTD